MRYIIISLVVLTLTGIAMAAIPFTVELATGFAADNLPIHSGWKYDVSADNLYYKEHGARLSVGLTDNFIGHISYCWLENRPVTNGIVFADDVPPYGHAYDHGLNQRISAIAFSAEFDAPSARISLGLIYYQNLNGVSRGDDYILNDDHSLLPTMSIELGTRGYIFGSFLNSMPLYSNGILSFGIGARYPQRFDHKVYVDFMPGIGYRGVYPIYRNFGLSLGLFYNDIGEHNAISCNVGVRSGFDL